MYLFTQIDNIYKKFEEHKVLNDNIQKKFEEQKELNELF
jgi:hypothetical protein